MPGAPPLGRLGRHVAGGLIHATQNLCDGVNTIYRNVNVVGGVKPVLMSWEPLVM